MVEKVTIILSCRAKCDLFFQYCQLLSWQCLMVLASAGHDDSGVFPRDRRFAGHCKHRLFRIVSVAGNPLQQRSPVVGRHRSGGSTFSNVYGVFSKLAPGSVARRLFFPDKPVARKRAAHKLAAHRLVVHRLFVYKPVARLVVAHKRPAEFALAH